MSYFILELNAVTKLEDAFRPVCMRSGGPMPHLGQLGLMMMMLYVKHTEQVPVVQRVDNLYPLEKSASS